jgi:hypothetical protein
LSMVIIFIPKTAIIVFAEKVDSSEPVNCWTNVEKKENKFS